MRDVFGLTMAVNPEKQAAHEIARLLNFPGFLSVDSFAKGNVEIVELKVDAKNPLNGTKLSRMQDVVHAKVLVCAVQRSGQTIMPDGNFVIKEGDRLFVTGEPKALHEMLTRIGVINMPVSNALITGGGRISFYLAEELDKSGIHATILDNDEEKCIELCKKLPNATVIMGDASSHSVLEREDVGQYNAVVSMTGLDELNIVTSMYAHLYHVPQIVTKLGRGESSELLDSLPIGSIVCPKELCTMHIVRYVRAMQAKKGAALTVHRIADNHAEAIEFEVDSDTRHIGEAFKDIHFKKNLLIVSVGRGAKTQIPNGNSSFHQGDTVVVIATNNTVILQLNDIFED
jgi:trk system potassium uptake protein TrkA